MVAIVVMSLFVQLSKLHLLWSFFEVEMYILSSSPCVLERSALNSLFSTVGVYVSCPVLASIEGKGELIKIFELLMMELSFLVSTRGVPVCVLQLACMYIDVPNNPD